MADKSILNSKIKIEEIYGKSDFQELDEIRYNFCISEAAQHRRIIFRNAHWNNDHLRYLGKRCEEIANSTRYDGLSDIERQTLASYIAFPDDVTFINSLLENNVSLKNISQLNICLVAVKRAVKNGKKTALTEQWQANVLTVCSRLKKYYGVDTPHLILNRANDILAHNLELFQQLEEDYQNRKTK